MKTWNFDYNDIMFTVSPIDLNTALSIQIGDIINVPVTEFTSEKHVVLSIDVYDKPEKVSEYAACLMHYAVLNTKDNKTVLFKVIVDLKYEFYYLTI